MMIKIIIQFLNLRNIGAIRLQLNFIRNLIEFMPPVGARADDQNWIDFWLNYDRR